MRYMRTAHIIPKPRTNHAQILKKVFITKPLCLLDFPRFRRVVGQGRLELPTPGLGNQCSVQLSYCPADGGYDTKYALHRLGAFW